MPDHPTRDVIDEIMDCYSFSGVATWMERVKHTWTDADGDKHTPSEDWIRREARELLFKVADDPEPWAKASRGHLMALKAPDGFHLLYVYHSHHEGYPKQAAHAAPTPEPLEPPVVELEPGG